MTNINIFNSSPEYLKGRFLYFLEKANSKFNGKYNYDELSWKNQNTKFRIECPHHGWFLQRPAYHLRAIHRCPKCGTISGINYCNNLGIFSENAKKINKLISKESRARAGIRNKVTRIKNGFIVPDEDLGPWKRYKRQVARITYQQPRHLLMNFDKKGKGKYSYNLDHKISVLYGFKNNIEPKIIGNIHNLQYITFEENRKKASVAYLM